MSYKLQWVNPLSPNCEKKGQILAYAHAPNSNIAQFCTYSFLVKMALLAKLKPI